MLETNENTPVVETTQTQATADGQQQQTGKTFSQEDLDSIIAKRLSRERKDWEAKMEEEKKKATMTEAERYKSEKEQVEKKLKDVMQSANEKLLKAEVKSACIDLGIVDAEAAFLLMDKTDLISDDGSMADVRKPLEALLATKPYLKAQQQTQVNVPNLPGNNSITPANNNSLTLDQLEKMSPKDFNANWEKLVAAHTKNKR